MAMCEAPQRAAPAARLTALQPGQQAVVAGIAPTCRGTERRRFLDLGISHPIFSQFFTIESLDIFAQAYNAGRPIFRGLFEGNDPSKRMQMFVNYNTDISQFWEWSNRGLRPIDQTNEAYKLGVNAIIYGLTH